MRMLTKTMVAISFVAVFGAWSTPTSAQDFDWNWKKLGKSARAGHAQVEMFGAQQSISIVKFHESKLKLEVVNDPAADADSTGAMAARHEAIAAVNGSYFNVKDRTPVTFVLEDDVIEAMTAPGEMFRTDGVIASVGTCVDIFPCDTASYKYLNDKYEDALAAGPMLMYNGEPARSEWPAGDSFYISRHPRTIVGKTSDGWVYMIVIDGRSKGNAAGMSIPECVELCQMLGLHDAINLDGGGSSALWTRKKGVISNPSDNRRFDHYGQRRVPNIVIISKKK